MVCSDAFIGEGIYNKSFNYKSYLNEYYFRKHKETYFINKYVSKFKKFNYSEVWDLSFLNSFRGLANPIITSSVVVEKSFLIKSVGLEIFLLQPITIAGEELCNQVIVDL